MGKLIIGENIQVAPGVTDLVVINVPGSYTSEHSGKSFIGGAVEVNTSPACTTISSGDTTTEDHRNYDCDASGAGFTLVITTALKEYNVVKIDATANAVTLQPDVGTINGAASITLTTQWQGKTIFFNGTDWRAF